jgi:agmatine deiminase
VADRVRAPGSPAAAGYAMPAEWGRHERTWMVFPHGVYEGGGSLADARAAWAGVARAVARFEPVTMIADPADVAAVARVLGDAVDLLVVPVDDAWARDSGPTFVRGDSGVAAVHWRFNGWGAQSWASWAHDAALGTSVAAALSVPCFEVDLVNEGGGVEVDGSGTVILTETVQRDPARNPGASRGAVEALVHDALGTRRAVWLPRGLAADYGAFGTRGHVDLLAKFVAPGMALVHEQRERSHPDVATSALARDALTAAGYEVIPIPAPATTHLAGQLVDWSYVNCYLVNGGVVAGVFGDARDDEAVDVLSTLFPDREVVTVDARPLFALGGGVHCVTQQQPA